ncbi:MAG: methyl-accepting chemotaxis protein [Lachnospiraceae bacterium]|nr:methyl-accepting chemotaxis protein [Lachnospiraceae bacterium]
MKKRGNMVRRIILIAAALALVMTAAIGIVGFSNIKKAYFDSFSEELKAAAYMMEHEINNEWEGDWSLSDGGQLRKGNTAIHDAYMKQVDQLHEKTGIHFTVFYGDTRYITSMTDEKGNRMEGTQASGTVVEKVLKGGNEYLATNFDIGGKKWYAYYLPLVNSDGSVVGMLFAGRETTSVVVAMQHAGWIIVIMYIGFFLFNWAVARVLITRSTRSIKDITGGLKSLEDGELSFYIHDRTFNRTDELGLLAETSAQLRDRLQDVITVAKDLSAEVNKSGMNLANSAETAAHVADQVASAVEDISRGAVSQAENVESSMNNTNEMGDSIDDITTSVEGLSTAASDMMSGANRTVDALTDLMSKNQEVMASMQDINDQIRLTNDSVKNIADASSIITSISEQTNLLSLNASIEAARAGEYGRGFAVVAAEIGSLAEQSKKAAVSISQIVETLVAESEKSVETIDQLSGDMVAQNEQLNSTKSDMDVVVTNVNNVEHSTKVIADKIHLLNGLKNSFGEIIEELSAISQQNAASTQETNASMEELSATFALISEAAADLRVMAETLNEKMGYFTIGEEKNDVAEIKQAS